MMEYPIFRSSRAEGVNVDFTFDARQSELIVKDVFSEVSITVKLDHLDLVNLGTALIKLGLNGVENYYEH